MRTRLLSYVFLLLSAGATVSCLDKDKEEVTPVKPEPLKDLVGRWDVRTMQTTTYDASGVVTSKSDVLNVPDGYYTIFKADKTFERYQDSKLALTGTYSYTNTTLTNTSSQNQATQQITTFTDTNLVLVNDSRREGRGTGTVEVLTLRKH
ncbi:hypothetical protein GCM10011378_16730 [Hymenobacter glacieicola]|uniref:Lipocalin-like domain-containing protein n=2 Tax=Hymenobacter glacieicola TaxID=1562124 RepID=A0ABQ1WSE0_9BACT|nr:hypothetical protein GCM10011378_16730 [Hymenobacter glacieicola]